jgi:uncharacterized small protein (DUF1192 family)
MDDGLIVDKNLEVKYLKRRLSILEGEIQRQKAVIDRLQEKLEISESENELYRKFCAM